MTRLILTLATLMAMSACSRDRGTPVPDESANTAPDLRIAEPDTAGLADSIALASRPTQPVAPVERAVRPKPAAAPKKPVRPKHPPRAARQPVDTAVTAPDTAVDAPDTAITAPDTAITAPDTAGTADTAVQGYAPAVADTSASPDTTTADTAGTVTPDTTTTPTSDSTATAAVPSSAAESADRTLPIGTQIHAALDDSISSRRDSAGRTVTAQVTENVTGSRGQILIPAGSTVQLTVTKLGSSKSRNSPGQLVLRVDGIQIGGAWKKLQADIQPVSRELRGRGVTGGDAAKVGVGAAGGAILGRVIGGNTKGAVIGGVVGAAGGAVVASETATRDVVVKAKTPLLFTLTAPLVTP